MPLEVGDKADNNSLPTRSHYDYYQHDRNESLQEMTSSAALVIPSTPMAMNMASPRSTKSLSSPSCSFPSTPFPTPSSYAAVKSPSSRDSRCVMSQSGNDSNSASRIPRRIKLSSSAETWASKAERSPGASWNGAAGKRCVLTTTSTSPVVGSATSVVTSCLLTTSAIGAGDAVNLDPEVENWLEVIPLSKKPFKNFHRDFADGVLMAEIMAFCLPKKVDLHNYVPASAMSNKKNNWDTLNQKVFSKLLSIKLSESMIDGITQARPGFIEKTLRQIHRVLESCEKRHAEVRVQELSALAASFNGISLEAPYVEELCLVRKISGEIPDCVIHQNIKYFPSVAFEDVSKNEDQLREKNNELCNKVRRLETLLSLKENHLQDLTSTIHELRKRNEGVQLDSSLDNEHVYDSDELSVNY